MLKVRGKVSTFIVTYEYDTVQKIIDLFHLGDMDLKYKTVAIDKIEAMEKTVNTKVTTVSNRLDFQTVINTPKIEIKLGQTTSVIQLFEVQLKYTIAE